MKLLHKLTIMSIIVVVLIGGASFFWINSKLARKDEEINSLQFTIDSLQRKIDSKENVIETKNSSINLLEATIENTKNFEKLLLKGTVHLRNASANRGYADSDYDDFSRNYKAGYYEVAQMYADSVDTYCSYARSNMDDAKSRFEQARKYAPSKKYHQLIDNYIKATDYAIQIYSEMHQASEYFSSACGYYADGNWTVGDAKIEKANKHIKSHDSLIDNYNAYVSDINAILDDW